jgi:hypothetical protein
MVSESSAVSHDTILTLFLLALSASSGQTRLWRIDYCRDDGTYTEYFGGHLGTNKRQTLPQIDLSLRETNVLPSAIQNQTCTRKVHPGFGPKPREHDELPTGRSSSYIFTNAQL